MSSFFSINSQPKYFALEYSEPLLTKTKPVEAKISEAQKATLDSLQPIEHLCKKIQRCILSNPEFTQISEEVKNHTKTIQNLKPEIGTETAESLQKKVSELKGNVLKTAASYIEAIRPEPVYVIESVSL